MKRYIPRILLLCVVSFGAPHRNWANGNQEAGTAAALFHSQHYDQALAIWEKMVNRKSNAGLYFNMGLAHAKLNQPAEAIYAYEQALRLCPLNGSYAKAIEIERKKLDNPVIPLNSFFLARWYSGWITLCRPGFWALLGLLILLGVLIAYLLSVKAIPGRKMIPIKTIRWIGITGLFCLASSFLSYQHLYKTDEGIMMVTCELKQASATESPTLRQLSAGEKVKIKDQIGQWYYVALLNLDYGWIKSDCVKKITLSGS